MGEPARHLKPLWRYLADAHPLHLLTAPVIWLCLMPALALDAMASFYQALCFPVYGIPKVRRSEYLVFDHLSALFGGVCQIGWLPCAHACPSLARAPGSFIAL